MWWAKQCLIEIMRACLAAAGTNQVGAACQHREGEARSKGCCHADERRRHRKHPSEKETCRRGNAKASRRVLFKWQAFKVLFALI